MALWHHPFLQTPFLAQSPNDLVFPGFIAHTIPSAWRSSCHLCLHPMHPCDCVRGAGGCDGGWGSIPALSAWMVWKGVGAERTGPCRGLSGWRTVPLTAVEGRDRCWLRAHCGRQAGSGREPWGLSPRADADPGAGLPVASGRVPSCGRWCQELGVSRCVSAVKYSDREKERIDDARSALWKLLCRWTAVTVANIHVFALCHTLVRVLPNPSFHPEESVVTTFVS